MMILAITLGAACAPTPTPGATAPTVISTSPGSVQNVPANTTITATFSEAMNPATVNSSTFKLMQGSTPISGTVTSSGNTATFIPVPGLALCTTYTASITTGVKNMAGSALASDYVWNFYTSCATSGPGVGTTTPQSGGAVSSYTGGLPPDLNQLPEPIPTVRSTNPTATCVAIDSKITVVFSEKMKPSTINTNTFTLMLGAVPVLGTVAYSGLTATFTPAVLVPNSLYTATITTGAKNLAGNALAANKVWTFTTCAALPTVISTIPINNDPVCLFTDYSISAIFSTPMKSSTINTSTFIVKGPGNTPVNGTVAYAGLTAVFTPSPILLASTQYTATITTGAQDLNGNALAANKVWTFTTCPGTDPVTTPTVLSTIPVDGAGTGMLPCVPMNSTVTVTFSKLMNAATITATSFTLKKTSDSTPVTALSIITVGNISTFTPAANLLPGIQYTATITTAAKDLAGHALTPANYVWSFTTCAVAPPAGPVLPPLLTADHYANLTMAGITNTGASLITGDMGVSPLPAASITGFGLALDLSHQFSTTTGPGMVTGRVYAADYAAPTPANLTVDILAITNAYTATANTVIPAPTVNIGSGHLGGLNLVPGVYKFNTNVDINSHLILTATGADDTWIFQIPGNLTIATNQVVTLAGGAQAKNIYWQVAGNTTLFPGSTFQGVILGYSYIALQTGATLHGKALSQTAVTLDAAKVLLP